MNGQDYIEVGQGVDSKVIGKDNSVSEYFAVIMALGAMALQGWLIAFSVLFLIIGFYWLEWIYAALVSLALTTVTPFCLIFASIRIFKTIKDIQEPKQERDDKGRFKSKRVAFRRMGKHVGDLVTPADGGESYIERWGRGVD